MDESVIEQIVLRDDTVLKQKEYLDSLTLMEDLESGLTLLRHSRLALLHPIFSTLDKDTTVRIVCLGYDREKEERMYTVEILNTS